MENTEKIWNRRFVLLFITNLLMMATFYAAVPIIPGYCAQNGISGSQIGIILTAMSITTVLFRPFAGYILDNFNRYRVYLLFLALFSLSFLGFAFFATFALLVIVRLYMGIVYSVCGSATMTLAGDVLPQKKVGLGINRFALTNSLGMAAGPFIGIQVQNLMSSKSAFVTLFVLTLVALFCVSCCRIQYPKAKRKKFKLSDAFYKPAVPFMLNMIFLMIPFGAVIAYSSILAQAKGFSAVTPYFYICLVAGILLSKFSTQKLIDAGRHAIFVAISLIVLIITMASYYFMETAFHFLFAGFLFGLGYGILQPLFQSFVTGTSPAPKRGAANATYLLSYDIGIGIGSLVMGIFQDSLGITAGMAVTAVCYIIGGLIYALYVDKYYAKLAMRLKTEDKI
jgi:predicted MFS family arabinose efflux permease